jgi:hypothetical protein
MIIAETRFGDRKVNMKTALRLTFAAFGLAIFNVSTAVLQAQFNYATNNGTIAIRGYTGPGGDVTIPELTNGLLVASVGVSASAYITQLGPAPTWDAVCLGARGWN